MRNGTSLSSSLQGRYCPFTISRSFWIKHSPSTRGGSALLPELPNPSSSLGAPDGNCTGITVLFSDTISPGVYRQLSASQHHLHHAPRQASHPARPTPPARTHTLRLFSAPGTPALHPPEMKGPSSASALGR